jgi:O-antigen ligase/Flp pilus assembly protein TadD
LDPVIDNDQDRRFPGAMGVALIFMTAALALGFLPGHPVGLELKAGLFLFFPVLAWLSGPRHTGRAVLEELSSAHGWGGLVVVGWVAFLEIRSPGVAPGETTAVLLAAWLMLAWMRTFTSGGLSYAWGIAVSTTVILAAGVGLAQIYPVEGLGFLRFPGVEQPVGTLGNRNLLAYLMALGVPECFYMLAGERTLGLLLGGVGALGGLAILVLAGSRGAWLALSFGVIARLILPAGAHEKLPRLRFLLLLAAVLLLPLAIAGQASRIESLFGPQKALTLRTRVFAWETVWPEVRDGSPLGSGPGTFPQVYPKLKEERLRAVPDAEFVELARAARVKRQLHLEWLELWLEWGTVGFGLVGLYLVLAVLAILKDHHRNPRPRERRRRRIGWVVLVVGLCAAGLSFPLQVAPLAWLMLGALARSLGPVSERPWTLGGIAVSLLLCLACAGVGARRLVSEYDLARGQQALVAGDAAAATAALQRARRFLDDPRAVNALGRVRSSVGDWQKAEQAFAQAEKLEPTYAHALNVGKMAMKRKLNRKAGEAFQRAWFRQPDQVTGFHLGAWFASQGRSRDAAGIWERARNLSGFTGQPGYSLARMLWKQGKLDEAAKVLDQEDRAARTAPMVDVDRAATRARLHMAILRLAIAVHGQRKDIPAQAAFENRFAELYPGVDRGKLGPVGQEEKAF